MNRHPNCNCAPDSPFLWMNHPRLSIFPPSESSRRSLASTASVEAQRARGIEPARISGLSSRSTAHETATRGFFLLVRDTLNTVPRGKR